MKFRVIDELKSVGLPFTYHLSLVEMFEYRRLDTLSLPVFLSLWKLHECIRQQADGSGQHLFFGEFVQMQALLADIGVTVGRASQADSLELMSLSNCTDREQQEHLWHDASEMADAILSLFEDPDPGFSGLMHYMMTEFTFSLASEYLPQLEPDYDPDLEDHEEIANIGATQIDYAVVKDDWRRSARLAFNIGIAAARLHTDFLGGTQGEDRLSKSNGHQPHYTKYYIAHNTEDYIAGLKRNFHLAQCQIWAKVCRPDLAHLLEGP